MSRREPAQRRTNQELVSSAARLIKRFYRPSGKSCRLAGSGEAVTSLTNDLNTAKRANATSWLGQWKTALAPESLIHLAQWPGDNQPEQRVPAVRFILPRRQ